MRRGTLAALTLVAVYSLGCRSTVTTMATHTVILDDACAATPQELDVNPGDRVRFEKAAGAFTVTAEQKSVNGGDARFGLFFLQKKFELTEQNPEKTSKKIRRGSGPQDYLWSYTVSASTGCSIDPEICIRPPGCTGAGGEDPPPAPTPPPRP